MANDCRSPLKVIKAVNAAVSRDVGVDTITVLRDGAPQNFAAPEGGTNIG